MTVVGSFQLQELPSPCNTQRAAIQYVHHQQGQKRNESHKRLQSVQLVTSLHVIRPCGEVFIQKYAVRRHTYITLTVLSSESCVHMLRDYIAQKQQG